MINLLACPCIRKGEPAVKTIGYSYQEHSDGLPELAILSEFRPTKEAFKDFASFTVEEIVTGMNGRAFLLHRDQTALESNRKAGDIDPPVYYGLLVSRDGPTQDHCECKGFAAQGCCKHTHVLRHLIEGGLIDDPRHDPRPEVIVDQLIEAPF